MHKLKAIWDLLFAECYLVIVPARHYSAYKNEGLTNRRWLLNAIVYAHDNIKKFKRKKGEDKF